MKIYTPQILWHNGTQNDNGKNAPLLSLSILQSGLSSSTNGSSHVLATCGNSSEVHLWKVIFDDSPRDNTASTTTPSSSSLKTIFETGGEEMISHLLSLERHERSVNVVKFSSSGLTLASGGDGGALVLWSIPPNKRGNNNGRHFWAQVEKETDVVCRVVSAGCEDVMDLSWAPDSRRFVVGSLDHSVLVMEETAENWKCVWRNGQDHLSYVQGVSWDPLGAYIASMSSDRTVRLYSRKKNKLPGAEGEELNAKVTKGDGGIAPKSKLLKYRSSHKKHHLFADESTMESFFRRLAWTTDGAFLVTPAALWGLGETNTSFATYLWTRHQFDKPAAVLSGLDKPSVVVRPCPTLFTIPQHDEVFDKENQNHPLPYRSVFAVLTIDTILFYDTHHIGIPLAIARGLHYAGLTDCAWTDDGRNLLVTSSDGYVSILRFRDGELGQPKAPDCQSPQALKCPVPCPKQRLPPLMPGQSAAIVAPPSKKVKRNIVPTLLSDAHVSKEKKRIAPTLLENETDKRVAIDDDTNMDCVETDAVVGKVTDLSLENKVRKKKKKIQPTLLTL